MAGEVIKSIDDLLLDLADNTSGNISALDMRDAVLTLAPDTGTVEDLVSKWDLALTAVYQQVMTLMPAPVHRGRFWVIDGNNALVNDWTPYTITPGTLRKVHINGQFSATGPSNNQDLVQMAVFQDGAQIGPSFELGVDNTGDRSITLAHSQSIDGSIGAVLDLRIRSLTGSITVSVSSLDLEVIGLPV